MYRIDNSMNDAPYQGIHIYNGDTHIITFWEDDAPVHEFNHAQRMRAQYLVGQLNADPQLADAIKYAKFI